MTDILSAVGQKQPNQKERFEKTRTLVYPDSDSACQKLAREVADLIESRRKQKKTVVLGLATGSTPVPFYRELIRLHTEEKLNLSNVITFNLDEYYGLEKDHPESYYRFMHDQLFDKVNIPYENIHIPDGTVPLDQVYDYCHDYEQAIAKAGGLDLQILGIGRTGHIGFNEPGSAKDSPTRMITLDRVTRADAAADFLGIANVPRSAITMGVGTILKADKIVLMAWGGNKADIVREAVEAEVTDQISASFLQIHDKSLFLVDQAAANSLTRKKFPWLVGSVNWDRSMIKRAVIWLANQVGAPILKLNDEDYNEHGVGELLATTGKAAYHINIDVFNQIQHTITGWPGGKKGTENEPRPERAKPVKKRVLILSPDPSVAVAGLGGTIDRLIEQGHEVTLAIQTSGRLRVRDGVARNFASVIQEMAETAGDNDTWGQQEEYANSILSELEKKGEFGVDSAHVRRLKGFILRGETRDAAEKCRLNQSESVRFLDLPFYETGRYRRFHLSKEDVDIMKALIDEIKPHSIFATGYKGDPSSMQALCFKAFREAFNQCNKTLRKNCYVWLYRGKDQTVQAHEIDMAVPMSPDQLDQKRDAIRKFQSITEEGEFEAPAQNQLIASKYDKLGMAQYEAIEAFEKMP